jgi:hypothetical protein
MAAVHGGRMYVQCFPCVGIIKPRVYARASEKEEMNQQQAWSCQPGARNGTTEPCPAPARWLVIFILCPPRVLGTQTHKARTIALATLQRS